MYAKLFSRIAQSSLMEEKVTTRYVFMMMLALADRHGDVIGTDVAIARMMNVTADEFSQAIGPLLAPDPDSNSQAEEGRRLVSSENGRGYRIVNYVSYREMKSDEEKREYMRNYMRDRRAGSKPDVKPVKKCKTSSSDVTQAEAEADTKAKAEKKNTPKGDEDELFEHWNNLAESIPALPKIAKVTPGRRAKAKSRLAEPFFRENWKTAMDTIKDRPFLQGHNQRGWIADIDWFLQPDAVIKIAEGKYKNDVPQPHQPTHEPVRDVDGSPVIPKPPKTYDDVED